MNTRIPDGEHRRFSRIPFDAQAELFCAGNHWHSHLIDLSLHGALIARPAGWQGKSDDRCALKIHLGGNETVINMDTSVAHMEEGRIGLHCLHIDLDSITHLRRFVELNLGDADLLNRELSALGKHT